MSDAASQTGKSYALKQSALIGTQMNTWTNDVEIITKSRLFDYDWYVTEYPDVGASGLSPVEHYVKFGTLLRRNPNRDFDTAEYIRNNLNGSTAINPFVHYIKTLEAQQNSDQKEKIKVSIICVTYNHEKYIAQTLDSMVSQKTDFEYEILVGDDCSQDRTPDILREYAQKYPQIVAVCREKNVGPARNFMDLARRIRGEYVAFCEGDDYWVDDEKLQIQADFLDANLDYSTCFHPVRVEYDGVVGVESIFPKVCEDTPDTATLVRDNFIQTNSVMYRWRYPNGLPENYNFSAIPGDWYMHLLHAEIGRIKYFDRVMGVYRRHPSGMWAMSTNAIELHRRYGNNEIAFFRDQKNRFGGLYRESFERRQISIFFGLAKYYIERNSLDELVSLCQRNDDTYPTAFSMLGYRVGHDDIASVETLGRCLRAQSKISVIVTSYNQEDYIARCLDSVLGQVGCFDLEIIVGDDGSKDKTPRIIEDYRSRYPDIIKSVGTETNIGMLPNLKRCVESCTGNYIAICEGDDYWISMKKLHKQMLFMRSNKSLDMCFNWVLLHTYQSDAFFPHAEQGTLLTDRLPFSELAKIPYTANFSCCFYKAQAVKNIPDEYYTVPGAADWLFNLYIADKGEVGFLRELLSVYTLHESGQWTGLSDLEKQERMKKSKDFFVSVFGSGRGFDDVTIHYKFKALDNNNLHDLLLCNIDKPFNGYQQKVETGTINLRGWALSREQKVVRLVVRSDEGEQLMNLNASRIDVVDGILGRSPANHRKWEFCGFDVNIPYKPEMRFDLGFDIEGERHWWYHVETVRIEEDKAEADKAAA